MAEATYKELSIQELDEKLTKAIDGYEGSNERLISAIGVYMLARKLGWKPIFLMHGRSTIKDYEKILDINIRETIPPVGELADLSRAWRIAKKLTNFWKAVKGETSDVRSTQLDRIKIGD